MPWKSEFLLLLSHFLVLTPSFPSIQKESKCRNGYWILGPLDYRFVLKYRNKGETNTSLTSDFLSYRIYSMQWMWYGYTFQDVFTLGSSTTTSTIKMGYVTSMGSSQQQLLDEGIFGLAFPALAQYSTPSPIKTWLDEAGLPNSYAFYMTTNAPGSQITFGGFAEELLGNTTVEYTDVIQTNLQSGTAFAYWTVAMSQFTLGATISGSGLTTIVDSGTSLIALPPNALIAVFQV
eukprot:jgi/Bigna1/71374/fgenesh1_pg.15_\